MAPTDSKIALDGVRYVEPGASWWLLALGPVLGLLGALTQLSGPGGVQWVVWLAAAMLISGFTALIVAARRRHVSVQVTEDSARFGQESIALADVTGAGEQPIGDEAWHRVLGGGYVTPRGTKEVPLRLADGTTVRAWARHPDRLRAAVWKDHDAGS